MRAGPHPALPRRAHGLPEAGLQKWVPALTVGAPQPILDFRTGFLREEPVDDLVGVRSADAGNHVRGLADFPPVEIHHSRQVVPVGDVGYKMDLMLPHVGKILPQPAEIVHDPAETAVSGPVPPVAVMVGAVYSHQHPHFRVFLQKLGDMLIQQHAVGCGAKQDGPVRHDLFRVLNGFLNPAETEKGLSSIEIDGDLGAAAAVGRKEVDAPAKNILCHVLIGVRLHMGIVS